MTHFILLAIIAGETWWLYRLGAFNRLIGWVTGAGASVTAFWSQLESLLRGWLS